MAGDERYQRDALAVYPVGGRSGCAIRLVRPDALLFTAGKVMGELHGRQGDAA